MLAPTCRMPSALRIFAGGAPQRVEVHQRHSKLNGLAAALVPANVRAERASLDDARLCLPLSAFTQHEEEG